MQRELGFSIFHNRYDKKSKPVKGSWDFWVKELSDPLITEERDTLAMILGHIPAGETHANDLVESVEAVGLDLDDVTEEQALGWLDDALGEEAVEQYEANVAKQIEESRNPPVESGTPWTEAA